MQIARLNAFEVNKKQALCCIVRSRKIKPPPVPTSEHGEAPIWKRNLFDFPTASGSKALEARV